MLNLIKRSVPTVANQFRSLTTKAIVTHPSGDGKLNWKFEKIELKEDLKPNEVLVKMEAVGICHTDLSVSVEPLPKPIVLGHEGVGSVVKVGSQVTNCSPGDPVLLSYANCEECTPCKTHHTAFCEKMFDLNFGNPDVIPFSGNSGTDYMGKFFGQSSFANHSIVDDTCIVNTKSLSHVNKDNLKMFGPLGCGLMTGSGAVANTGAVKPGESVAIYGLGGVGLSAIMTAALKKASPVIAIDINESKLEFAKKAGATHTILAKSPEFVHEEILRITNGDGANLSVECIGGAKFVEQALHNASLVGRVVMVGAKFGDKASIDTIAFMMAGKQLLGCVEGDAEKTSYIPQMIQWFVDGKYPFDKLLGFYKVEEYEKALEDMKAGKVVKPILLFD